MHAPIRRLFGIVEPAEAAVIQRQHVPRSAAGLRMLLAVVNERHELRAPLGRATTPAGIGEHGAERDVEPLGQSGDRLSLLAEAGLFLVRLIFLRAPRV